jgi:nitric oxide synthase oxygenase domain/subunit
MIRPLEPRVGENRPIQVLKQEAEAFLKEMFAEGFFHSSKDFEQRLKDVIIDIEKNSVECLVWEDIAGANGVERTKVQGVSSNGYVQTKEELEWGVRVAWRNSRKCIMRAYCWDLRCIDLRDIKTSKGMVDAIIKHCPTAYNGGRIIPTGKLFLETLETRN